MGNIASGIAGSLIFALGATVILLIFLTSGAVNSYAGMPPQFTLALGFFGFFAVGMGFWVIQNKK